MRLLIVEDDQLMQLLNSNLMEIWGYNYDLAFNGYEAVEFAVKNKCQYDVCLMDIDMPVMCGLDAVKVIRQSGPRFPIMAYTPDINYKKECLDSGIDVFVEKPCAPEKLFQIINDLTKKSLESHIV